MEAGVKELRARVKELTTEATGGTSLRVPFAALAEKFAFVARSSTSQVREPPGFSPLL